MPITWSGFSRSCIFRGEKCLDKVSVVMHLGLIFPVSLEDSTSVNGTYNRNLKISAGLDQLPTKLEFIAFCLQIFLISESVVGIWVFMCRDIHILTYRCNTLKEVRSILQKKI